jgi:hypothetical protein
MGSFEEEIVKGAGPAQITLRLGGLAREYLSKLDELALRQEVKNKKLRG